MGKKVLRFFLSGILVLASILITLLLIEFGFRFYAFQYAPETGQKISALQEAVRRSRGEKPRFEPHPYLSYFPSDVQLTETGCIIDANEYALTPPPETFRIACLGGSTTMRSYPPHLAQALQPCFPGVNIEVMDWGCSGWTIVESLINYTIRGRLFHPDLVILHHGINDVAPRFRNSFRFDYSHYRKPARDFRISPIYHYFNPSAFLVWLLVRMDLHAADLDTLTVQPYERQFAWPGGVIPPQTAITFQEAVQALGSLCKGEGTSLLLAGMVYNVTGKLNAGNAKIIDEHNAIMKEYAARNDAAYVHAQDYFALHKKFFVDEAHLNDWGDQIKANIFANAIARITDATPRIWVTDDRESAGDLTGKSDEDAPGERELVIHWDQAPEGTTKIHIYVTVDGVEEKFLGYAVNGGPNRLSWHPGSEFIHKDFRDGPQFGHRYSFAAWFVHPGTIMPLATHEPVSFLAAP
ncbi:MAG: SGNH/GDSL hydrolase family protein [Candidatus Hinthialibacter sp.]